MIYPTMGCEVGMTGEDGGLEFPQKRVYGCDRCNDGYSRLEDLKRHRQVKHEGVRCGCDQ